MTIKKILLLSINLIISTFLYAQMDTPSPCIYIYVNDIATPMNECCSQTEIKKGWDIQGFNIGSKTIHYFSGSNARQITDRNPKFAIYPKDKEKLNDYVLIRLKEKRGYRQLPKASFLDCSYIRVELDNFKIKNLENMGYEVSPISPLFPGEYIIVNITQDKINEYGDFKAYDFCVIK